MRIAVLLAVAALGLAACYYPTASFRPLTRGMLEQRPVVREALEIYDGDLRELRDGGALYLGTMTMELSDGPQPAKDAAHFGATHYLLKRAKTDKVGVGYGMYSHVESVTDATYALYRVPRDKWSDLPEKLRPAK